MIAPTFRKGSVKDLRATIERHVDDLLDAIVERGGPTGTFDLVGDLAYPMPVMVICELMGIPDEDGPDFRRWVQLVALGLDPIIDAEHARGEPGRPVRRCASTSASRCEPSGPTRPTTSPPRSSTSRRTATGSIADELIAQLQTLYIAGHEPATAVLGNGIRGLTQPNPTSSGGSGATPTLVPQAVVELLRYDGPNQFVRRIAVEDLEFDGGTVPAGAVVYPCIGAANHDPDEFGADADRIRVDRPEAVHHLQFGAGIHSCLGTHLARLELEVALTRLIERFTHLELAAEPTWSPRMVLRSVNDLWLRYET